MTSLRILPPVPRPPHDPTWLALGERIGWRAASLDHVRVDPADGALTLALSAGARALDEPSGSLGGLVPPSLVAVGAGGVWLLDAATVSLRVLDACDCRFRTVPCFGGAGAGARQLSDPAGIAIARHDLVVVDAGNRRVSVFSLRGYALRGTLAPPASEVAQPWTPVAAAADRAGRVFVADPANGCVHRFAPHGVWETAYRALGAVRHLAVDCGGRLYVVSDGSAEARVLDRDGVEVERVRDVAALRERFPTLPFRVDRAGAIDFGHQGAAPCGAFDAHGEPLPHGAAADPVSVERDGTYVSEGLDSGIARCQWHRIVLAGCVPAGTSVTVSTHASEVDEPDDLVAALPDDAWDTWQTARAVDGAWDCLVRSAPGRFLRLRVRLRGDGRSAPRLRRARVEFPRVSLARHLPAVFGADPAASDFTDRFLAIFDTTLRSIERQVDTAGALFDPRSAPATPGADGRPDFLTWLASWVGIALDRHWPEARRREFVRRAPALFDRRGTVEGLRELLLLFLGLPAARRRDEGTRECRRAGRRRAARCTPRPLNCDPPDAPEPYAAPPLLLEHWRLRRWLFVGAGRLGEQAVLWGNAIVARSRLDDGARTGVTRLVSTPDPYRDPLHVHASRVTVFVPACVGRDERGRKGLENLMRSEVPAHVRWHLELVEPRFRIGVQSMIGYDAVVGRYPAPGVTVGETTLSRATVLGPAAGPSRPSMRVGGPARVGTTTRLD